MKKDKNVIALHVAFHEAIIMGITRLTQRPGTVLTGRNIALIITQDGKNPHGVKETPYEERRRLRPYPELFIFSPARFLTSVILDRELIDPLGARFARIRDSIIY